MRRLTLFLTLIFAATACFAGVTISSPSNGATVGSPVHFVASASGATTIASMILYVDGTEKYRTYSNKIDTYVSLGSGSHYVQINSWDVNGGTYRGSENIYVSGTSTSTSTSTSGTWVTLTAPSNGAGVGSPFTVTANAGSPNGISGWVIYADDKNVYQNNNYSNSLSASVNLGSGSHTLYVRAWDRSNGQYGTSSKITVNVGGTSSGSTSGSTVTAGTPIYNIEQMSGWGSCSDCAGKDGTGPIAGYSMTPGVSSPSLDGKSTKFSIWGDIPYSNALWWKSVSSIIGDTSKPHHFIYDAYFYITDPGAAQAIEFDINQFVNGHSLIFGTQCNLLNGKVWDIWDNRNNKWVHTSKYCGTPAANTWHHVTIEVERASDGGDWLHYISIALDGNKSYIDAWYPPASTTWTGVTVNFQLDGDYKMTDYSVWLDKLTLSYW